jgi:hypothetical protein
VLNPLHSLAMFTGWTKVIVCLQIHNVCRAHVQGGSVLNPLPSVNVFSGAGVIVRVQVHSSTCSSTTCAQHHSMCLSCGSQRKSTSGCLSQPQVNDTKNT